MNTKVQHLGAIFGQPIAVYTRRQAIQDSVLVDVSQVIAPCPFRFPVAMTRGVWAATVEAGGRWEREKLPEHPEADLDGFAEVLNLPGGQDVKGRTWDVFHMLRPAIRGGGSTARARFVVLVGRARQRPPAAGGAFYSVIGPGDDAAPVITILLEGED